MNEILLTNDNLFVSNDKFIVDNMLTEEDLDLELGPYVWNDLSSNDSNSSALLIDNDTINTYNYNSNQPNGNGLTPPETPPSSDRSSPPNFADLSTIIPSEQSTHQFLAQNMNNLSNVRLLPAIGLCPPVMSPMTTFIANESSMSSMSSMLTIEAQNKLNINNMIHNNNNINTCIDNNRNGLSEHKLHLSQLKREARKLRNREAASISRKRKQEYVDRLEERINVLLKENADLRLENEKLKHELSVEKEKRQTHKRGLNYSIETNCNCRTVLNSSYSNKKATLSLLAVIFMLGLNLAPFSGVLITSDKSISSVDSNLKHHLVKHGSSRTLLWETTNDEKVPIDVIRARETTFNSSNIKDNSSLSKVKDTDCKTYINQTESLRLESDLRDWLLRIKMEKEEVSKQKRRLIKSNKVKSKSRFNKPIPLPRLKALMQKRTQTDISDINDYAIESYSGGLKIPQIKYEDLLSAIHRRDDTFYFLSFSVGDHLLIPPIANNGTDIRPRFSLIMPSVMTLNESSTHGTNVTYQQILMMQIDCEVINTKMVFLNSSPNSKPSSDGINKISEHNAKSKSAIGSRNTNAINRKNKVQ